jgi:hypothetical protein
MLSALMVGRHVKFGRAISSKLFRLGCVGKLRFGQIFITPAVWNWHIPPGKAG